MKKDKTGFTLAEVLITLTILGVIAAITIPNVIHKVQDRMTVTKLRKAFANFDNAFKQMTITEGNPSTFDYSNINGWNIGLTGSGYGGNNGQYVRAARSNVIASHIAKYMNVKKAYYNPNSYSGQEPYKSLNPANKVYSFNCRTKNSTCQKSAPNHPMVFFETKDGVLYGIATDGNFNVSPLNCSICHGMAKKLGKIWFELIIDVNGIKGPNAWGEDIFTFLVMGDGLHPGFASNTEDTNDNTFGSYYVKMNCDKTRTTGSFIGYSCGNYIMRHGNMDYKYKNLTAAEFY